MLEEQETVYLANTVSDRKPKRDQEWTTLADVLGQNIFPTSIGSEDISKIYIKIGKRKEDLNYHSLSLRIKSTTQSAIIYSGMIGSGKTMSLKKFHRSMMNKKSTSQFDHPDGTFNLKQRIIPYLSFSAAALEDIHTEVDVRKQVIEVIINALDGALKNSGFRENEDWEIHRFWDYMFIKIEMNEFESRVFSHLSKQLETKGDDIENRAVEFKKLQKQSGIRYLHYLFELYGYLRNIVCKDDLLFVFIIIDNVDHSSRTVQQFFSEKIRLFADERAKDPVIVLAVRPETTLSKNARSGTSLMDFVDHMEPNNNKVLSKRIKFALGEKVVKKFVGSKEKTEEEKKAIVAIEKYLNTLDYRLMTNSVLRRFINAASNGSARIAVWLAQSIFFQRKRHILKEGLDQGKIIRACIRRNQEYYKYVNVNVTPIRNMFSVEGCHSIHALLIKPRILHILMGDENRKYLNLGEILEILHDFGYPNDMQLRAVNELIETPFPLMLSYGSGEYLNIDHLFESENDRIEITKLGEGYGQTLIFEISYIQEVMFDTYVKRERFKGKHSDVSVSDRFQLLSMFLSEMIEIDNAEMSHLSYSYSGNKIMIRSRSRINHMFSYQIVNIVTKVIEGIVERNLKDKKLSPQKKKEWRDMRELFQGISNWSWQTNSKYFN